MNWEIVPVRRITMSEQRKRILKMLEEGLITADEAEELLQVLEDKKAKESSSHFTYTNGEDFSKKESFQKDYTERKSTKHKIFDFLDETLQKIKKIDLDWSFGSSVEVSQIYQYEESEFSSFHIAIKNGKVHLQTWDEPSVRIECRAKVYTKNEEIDAKQLFAEKLIMNITNQQFYVELGTKKIKAEMIIYIPNHLYKKGEIRLFNGPIQLENLQCEKLKANTSNGKIVFKNVSGEEWDINGVNNQILLDNVVCDECEVETMNGAITLDGRFGKIESQLVSGSIDCHWHGDGEFGYFKNTTGSIQIYVPAECAVEGELKTSVGNVECELPNFQTSKKEHDLLKKSLHFRTEKNTSKTLFIEAESKTGSIKVKPLKS
jgi:DUF4097 and DUF4098 domain-containing protein YvlB